MNTVNHALKLNVLFLGASLYLLLLPQTAKTQLYAGGSYVYAQITDSGLDDASGFSFDLQAEFDSFRDKVVFMPSLRFAILDSEVYSPAYPFYIKNLSFSPLVAYKLIEFKSFSISPYGGPFISWLEGRRAPSLLFNAAYISDNRFGAEFGIEFKLKVYDFCTLKLNPINLLIGNEFYRQGHLNVLLNF